MKRMGLVLLLLAVAALPAFASDTDVVRIGIVADVHAHDTDSPAELKVMTNYAERLGVFVNELNVSAADAAIQLGDLVNGTFVMGADLGDNTRVPQLLDAALAALAGLECPLHHVLGNHDMYDLSKSDVLAAFGLETGYYGFDLGGFHIVVLDAEFNPDGTDYDHVFMRTKGFIPAWELDWLRADLAATDLPTVVCIHQPLDSEFEALAGGPPVANRVEVVELLAESEVVVAVLQGHDHENRYIQMDGIHYITFAAMVDHTEPTPATFALMTLDAAARTITIEGYGVQESYNFLF